MSKNLEQVLVEIGEKARAGLITRESLLAFLTNPNGSVASKLAADTYPVSIDFGKSIEGMVTAGHYDWSNDNVTSKNFPVNGTDVAMVVLELVHLNKLASSEDALSHMEANGLRSANMAELLAFGATYPEIQREFPIICLGSSWIDPDGSRHVPCLDRDGSGRELSLDWFGGDWNGVCRFLAVRKSV